MHELTLRAADRLGTTEAFEKAFEIAVRQTDPLRNIPHTVNGDINTTTYKRKGPATSTIHSGDTHRHDRVAVTSQVTRRVKGRLHFDFTTTQSIPEDFRVPTTHTIPEDIPDPDTHTIPEESKLPTAHTIPEDIALPTQTSQITTLSSSTELSTELLADDGPGYFQQDGPRYFQAHQDVGFQAEDATDSLDRQDTHVLFRAPQVGSFNQEVHVGCIPQQQDLNHESPDQHDAAHPPEQDGMANTNIPKLSSDSELRQTQARAGQGTHPVHAHPRTDQDSDDDVVVLRVTPRARPPTRAFPINVPTVDEMVDQLPVGVMHNGQAVVEQDVDKRFWHLSRIHPSRNPACNAAMTGRGAPRRSIYCKFQKPRVPEVMPVLTGTNLSQEEVDFLTERGLILVHRNPMPILMATDRPSVLEIRINVDAYPQKVISAAPDFHFQARGTKPCKRKTSPSGECSKKLQLVRSTTMMLTGSWSVIEGNGYGRMYRIFTHLNADIRSYIVQLCCFPTCSCEDFFERESRRSTYLPCKHIYWVYMNILGLRPDANIMHQPVFSRNEVDKLVSMETMTAAARDRVVFG
ncbi:hypothetical protein R1sor_016476 [Riccia sorocarpa]|uniref:SWIM-type domain-containing protein n=1 Tax=Riccia sorocarpa TaxID=122646 RepID=A0ABD3HF53_9MARC